MSLSPRGSPQLVQTRSGAQTQCLIAFPQVYETVIRTSHGVSGTPTSPSRITPQHLKPPTSLVPAPRQRRAAATATLTTPTAMVTNDGGGLRESIGKGWRGQGFQEHHHSPRL